jgi:ribose transport system ATP-binding protein
MPKDASPALLVLQGIGKSYRTPVLDGVNLEIRRGEVHALVGANGAGKSTLAKITAGLSSADSGAMFLEGKRYAPLEKADAEAAGVQIVQQELNLIGTLSVAENLFFSRLPRSFGLVDRVALERHAREALAVVGLAELEPRVPVGGLGVGVQQLVEIAGALARRSRLLILDEPTAALTDTEVETLFENVKRLAASGTGILYISHRLDELKRIADRATVLRDGRVVLTDEVEHLTRERVVAAMAGKDAAIDSTHRRRAPGATALRVEGTSFEVRHGEIFGLAGLIGSGRTSLLRAIFDSSAGRALVALVPEDRRRHGLLLPRSVALNLLLGASRKLSGFAGWLDPDKESSVATATLDRLEVQRASLSQPVAELSGGNQQKVVIGRWLLRDAGVFLFDEPTRGIDVTARAAIHRLLDELARAGKAIVVASSDTDELLSICDRIGVMAEGRLTAVFERGHFSREAITHASLGSR